MQHLDRVRQGVAELTDDSLRQVLDIFEGAKPQLGEHVEPLIAIVEAERERRAALAHIPTEKVQLAAKRRDLNSRGRGIEEYRLLGSLDGDTLAWADQHSSALVVQSDWCPRGIRASERKCALEIEADAGLLVVGIEKSMGRGQSAPAYRAGITDANETDGVRWEMQEGCPVRHAGIKKRDGQFVHVVEVDGVRREYTSG